MKRVLVLFYTQTGQTHDAVRSLVAPLDPSRFEIVLEPIRTVERFGFPWTIGSFFGVMPECVLGRAPAIEPPSFAPDARFDLVVLAWQVWFLAPSLPVQAFLRSPWARVLRDRRVIGLVVCRNMWHTASETMKRLIAEAGGALSDSIVVTDQGPPWAGFLTTPRWMLTGRRGAFFGLPPAGVSEATIRGLSRFGEVLNAHEGELDEWPGRPLFRGMAAVPFEARYVVPELIGRWSFRFWARLIRAAGPRGAILPGLLTAAFVVYLIAAILLLVPLGIVATFALYPWIRRPFRDYVTRLKCPSGVAEP